MAEDVMIEEYRQLPLDIQAHAIMNRAGFKYMKKAKAIVWAARWRACEVCGAPVDHPCLNMSQADRVADLHRKRNKVPHHSRVDWQRLIDTLNERGFW